MNRIKLLLLGLTAVIALAVVVVPSHTLAARQPAPAPAPASTPAQTACNAVTGNNDCTDSSGGPSLNSLIKTIINIFSLVVGITAVIMIMVGGFKFITAGGDSNSVSSARSTVTYALIGLVVVAMAQFIVQFVLNKIK